MVVDTACCGHNSYLVVLLYLLLVLRLFRLVWKCCLHWVNPRHHSETEMIKFSNIYIYIALCHTYRDLCEVNGYNKNRIFTVEKRISVFIGRKIFFTSENLTYRHFDWLYGFSN